MRRREFITLVGGRRPGRSRRGRSRVISVALAPGGNITGLRYSWGPSMDAMWVEALKETAPISPEPVRSCTLKLSRIRAPSGLGEISRSLWGCNRRSRQLDHSLREEKDDIYG